VLFCFLFELWPGAQDPWVFVENLVSQLGLHLPAGLELFLSLLQKEYLRLIFLGGAVRECQTLALEWQRDRAARAFPHFISPDASALIPANRNELDLQVFGLPYGLPRLSQPSVNSKKLFSIFSFYQAIDQKLPGEQAIFKGVFSAERFASQRLWTSGLQSVLSIRFGLTS